MEETKSWKRSYVQELVLDLFTLSPDYLLTKFPKINRRLGEDPSFRYRINDVVKTHESRWQYAKSLDIYDATISAGQAAAEVATGFSSYVIGKLAELPEIIPKIPYLYAFAKKTGKLPALLLGLYELVSIFDPTELADLFPAYTAAELYAMYKDLKKKF